MTKKAIFQVSFAQVRLGYEDQRYEWDLSGPIDEPKEIRERVGKVEVRLAAGSGELSYSIWRRDIEQNMFGGQ